MPAPAGKTVVLVTGCTAGGIGWHLCAALAGRGDALVYASARRLPAMDGLAERGCRLVQLDVASPESVAAAVAHVVGDAGRIDVLVNNAGIAIRKPIVDFTMAEVRQLFEVNYIGLVAMCAEVTPHMLAARRGRIYNIGSGLAYNAVPCMGHYSATKFAVRAFSDMQRVELAPFGVKVCFVAPGYIKTHIADADHHLPRGSIYHSFPRMVANMAASVFLGTTFEAATRVEAFAPRLARVVMAPSPPRHWLSGHLWWFPWLASMAAPLWALDLGYRLLLGLTPGCMVGREAKTA